MAYTTHSPVGYLPRDVASLRIRHGHPDHKALDTIGWPILTNTIQSDTESKIIDTDYSKKNGLICIEFVQPGKIGMDNMVVLPSRELNYIDPKSDYICVRQESFRQRNIPWEGKEDSWLEDIDADRILPDETPQIREIIEVAQTEAGQWYPQKTARYSNNGTPRQEKRMRIPTVYLQTNPKFPDGILDRENLPKSPSLINKTLPNFENIELNRALNSTENNAILLCFFDMNQRPSRHCITQLSAVFAEVFLFHY